MAASRSQTALGGGAPAPDPNRVALIKASVTDDAQTCAAFAEPARAVLAALNDRTLAETRTSDLGECAVLLGHMRDRLEALDVSRLQPSKGLSGLFDSRRGRLKQFRAAYQATVAAVTAASEDIADRGQAIDRKGTALETLWSDTRTAVAELDAHIAAARGWLADQTLPSSASTPTSADPAEVFFDPVEAQADAEAALAGGDVAEQPVVETERATVTPLPHPLQARVAVLEAARAVAIGRLPLLRAAQNADCRAPAALKAACDAVAAWRDEWKDALGLSGRKPRRIRPDPFRLTQAGSALIDQITAAERELAAAQARRSELNTRIAPLDPSRIAA